MYGPVKTERIENDVYETPPELCAAITSMLKERLNLNPASILEPSAGSGRFLEACKAEWPNAERVAIELRPECEPQLTALADQVIIAPLQRVDLGAADPFDLIIGNPPFVQAEQHVTALSNALDTDSRLVFLLRLSFLGAAERLRTVWANDFWLALEFMIPVIPRPSFRNDGGTDASEYGVFVWRRREAHVADCRLTGRSTSARLLAPLAWNKPRRQRAPVVERRA